MSKTADLTGSVGYQVHTRDGRIGSVAAVLPRAPGRSSAVLLVHSGLMCCSLTGVPVDDVETVDVSERRVVLRDLQTTMRRAAPSGARGRILDRA